MQQSVNKDLVRERFTVGLATYAKEAVVQKNMATELAALIAKYTKSRQLNIFEAGCGSGFLTSELINNFLIENYTANDLVPECEKNIHKLAEKHQFDKLIFLSGDIEALDIENNYDVVCGNAIFQWLTDPFKFWQKMVNRIAPDGIVAITLFGQKNFEEISRLTGNTLNYPSLESIKNIFSSPYEILECYTKTITLKFGLGRDVLRHIRHTGTGGIKREHWGKKQLLDFEEAYAKQFSDSSGLISLTYQPIYLIAKIKSQNFDN